MSNHDALIEAIHAEYRTELERYKQLAAGFEERLYRAQAEIKELKIRCHDCIRCGHNVGRSGYLEQGLCNGCLDELEAKRVDPKHWEDDE